MTRVSVLMSVYNDEKYLRDAVDSILNQTFTDFEFIIIDDCSTDSTSAILDSYTDSRIVRLRNSENLGLTQSLNRGLDVARGEYMARMDADDISLPGWLEAQARYMDQHPEVGGLSPNYVEIDAQGQPLKGGIPAYYRPGYPMHLRWQLIWVNPLSHPGAMFRQSVLQKNSIRYDPQFLVAQDYDLWNRLGKHCALFRTLEVYMYRRVTATRITNARYAEQMAAHYRVMQREIRYLFVEDISRQAVDTLFTVLVDRTAYPANDYAGAVAVLIAAYRYFLALPMSRYEREQITSDVVFYLIKIGRTGGMYPALLALWRLRSILLVRVLVSKIALHITGLTRPIARSKNAR